MMSNSTLPLGFFHSSIELDMCDQLFFTGSVSKNTNNMNFPLKTFGISKNVSIFAEAI
jgi:hypothetical protein